MATGVVSWSQTAASNANADANANWAEGMAPSQVNDSARAIMASVAKWRDDMAGTLLSSGSSTAFTVTSNQGFGSLSALSGQTIVVRFGATNGAAPTLNIDGLGAKAINVDSNTAIATGAVRGNSIHHLTYDNSLGVFILHGGHSLVEPGRIATHGSSTAPAGWLNCDGSGVSRTTFADLFAAISTTFGSSDGASFKVPNFLARFTLMADPGNLAGAGVVTMGSTGGDYQRTLTTNELPTHNHTINVSDPGHTHNANADHTGGTNNAVFDTGNAASFTGTAIQSAVTGITATSVNAGSGNAFFIIPPRVAVNFIIKT